jgi:NADPH:quinone reductase-like Zn-dependent oxidoreductase
MLAVTIRAHGGPEQVLIDDVPRPAAPGPRDVVVALQAAALNHLDLFVLGGLPGVPRVFPHVLGADGAGLVEAVGAGVTAVGPGDRVVLNPGLSCHACAYCAAGEHSLCPTFRLLGEHVGGTFAEAITVPETNVAVVPATVSWVDAAAFPLTFLTAWRMVVTRAAVRPGETVLIWGIGGGVALAALAIAKQRGARVVVTSSSDAKLERARSLGADATLNHATADVPREVRALTGTGGADVVVETVGEATWDRSLRALAKGGRLVTCGATTGPSVGVDVRRLFWNQYALMGSTMGNEAEFRQVVGLLADGTLRPVVDSVVPVREARAAFERMASGRQFGKLVLDIAATSAVGGPSWSSSTV